MNARVMKVAPLLFGSGACALVYQVAWLRQMRLIFGASTAASAAVLAIFMGGLGLGSALLGRRADRHPRPLVLYARLELGIAAAAALTPLLVDLARSLYVWFGGSVVLGLGGATVMRMLLATLVLCVPTFLMGGTLPAAAKAVETNEDVRRRHVALLYGVNTLGAVTGAFGSTFFLLEAFGVRQTLWLACLVNALVGITARIIAGRLHTAAPTPAVASATLVTGAEAAAAETTKSTQAPVWFVLTAAAVVGFSFLLMELVWYRMLGPLLGGSSFTFGLILAVALLGVALGGAAYALFDSGRPATLNGFALTCTFEAVGIALPYALGDRIALLTIFLRPLGTLGFGGLVLGWTIITALVVLPAAFVAGVQFPVLIALLGRGRDHVARHVGLTYAWNTVGSIGGSLAGGFGLIPLLSATGTWRAVVAVLIALAVSAMVLSLRARERRFPLWISFGAATVAGLLLTATGPTAAWRHSPIGAGRVSLADATQNRLRDWTNDRRRYIEWSTDGVESAIAIENTSTGYAFLVNGKSDGSARGEPSTQVMGGVVGALLHPNPKRALVIGLGTGSTAGWLGAIPTMERVDVVELEPAILEVARKCSPVNHDVLDNPKVHISIGDAREVLLTTPERYDIIFSEPSNPFRAGVASLFTQEFYRAVSAKLAPDGVFVQWLQAYEVDSQTLQTAYATMASVFPSVETWHGHPVDLLLVGTMKPSVYDADSLRPRVAEEPFKTALADAWRAAGLEAFLARFVARSSLAEAIAHSKASLFNTDDLPRIEFAFARSLGRALFAVDELRQTARTRNEDRPEVRGTVDWERVEDARAEMFTAEGLRPIDRPYYTSDQRFRAGAQAYYLNGDLPSALTVWRRQPREPIGSVELVVVASALANSGDNAALPYIEQLRAVQPLEADAVLGLLRWRQNDYQEAAVALETAFTRYHTDPWPLPSVMSRTLKVAVKVAAQDRAFAQRLYTLLKTPFAAGVLDDERRLTALTIAAPLGLCAQAWQLLEPNVPWQRDMLTNRAKCYRDGGFPETQKAQEDLDTFLRNEPVPFAPPTVPTASQS